MVFGYYLVKQIFIRLAAACAVSSFGFRVVASFWEAFFYLNCDTILGKGGKKDACGRKLIICIFLLINRFYGFDYVMGSN